MRASDISPKFCKNISDCHINYPPHAQEENTDDNSNSIKVLQNHEGIISLHLKETTEGRVGVQESTCYMPWEKYIKIES